MDKSRAFFQVKHGQTLGDRLILRFPGTNARITKALQKAGVLHIPNQITVGYYLQLDEPDGAWAFMPVNTPATKAVLGERMVQNRIAEDLVSRM